MIKVNLVADMDCDRCGRPAVIFQPYSGLSLCTHHLIGDIRKKGKKTVRYHSWLRPGDRIAISLSGDLHDAALLDFMKVLINGRKDVSIFVIISENFHGWDEYSGIPCIYTPDTDRTVPAEEHTWNQIPESQDPFRKRREAEKFLTSLAKENNATALAMPYSLQDHAEWALWRAMSVEVPGITMNGHETGNRFRIIRPFMHIPEDELTMYALMIAEEYCPDNLQHRPCRQEGTLISRMLEEFGHTHPGAQFALVNIWDDISRLVRQAGCDMAPPGDR